MLYNIIRKYPTKTLFATSICCITLFLGEFGVTKIGLTGRAKKQSTNQHVRTARSQSVKERNYVFNLGNKIIGTVSTKLVRVQHISVSYTRKALSRPHGSVSYLVT
jgi:hypothetical protein